MPNCQKNENKNDLIDSNKNRSFIDKNSLILFFLLIIVYSIGFSGVNAMPQDDYVGSEYCGKCHITQYEEWSQTKHSEAYTDPIFQAQWQAQGSPDVCLSCHTTNFDLHSGDFEFENVGCELCHSPSGEDTDPASMSCNKCHSVSHYPTYTEWLESEHSHANVGCDSCHDPMSLELRTEDPNDLCKDCHTTVAVELVTGEHGVAGYECVDCHMVTSLADFENGVNGMTGHSFLPKVPNPDCSQCHDVSLDAHTVWGATDENCLTCHDHVFMTMLHLLNGTDVAMSDSSILCQQCHNDVYYEWSLGIHANSHEVNQVCTDCHYPMNPYIMMNKTLPAVNTIETVNETPKPIIPPVFFFIAVIGALLAVLYTFVFRRQ
jgi:hypothetical protein